MIEINFYVIYTDGTKHEEKISYDSIEEAEEEIRVFTTDSDPFLDVAKFGKTVMMSGVVRPF